MADAPGFNPPSGCGHDLDLDKLWLAAKLDPGKHPEKGKFGYAVLDGDNPQVHGKYNLLLVPKVRIKGIECDKILDPNALNLWKYAWQEAKDAFQKTNPDLLVAVNSADGRTDNQLHIHLTALKRDLRPKLDSLSKKIPKDLNKWNDSIFELGPSLNHKTYVYRIAHVDNLDNHNPFNLLDQYIGQKCKPDDRFAQSLAIVAGTNGSGYYLLATQGQPDTKHGQPEHMPKLNIGGNWGTTTAEGLMDRDWQ